MIVLPLVGYVLKAAARDRLILSCIGLTILGSCLSIFMGGAAMVEKQEFVVVYTAGGLRLLCVFGMVLFVAFYIRRSFDQRDIEFLLSRPLTRSSLIVSHAAALVVVAAMLAVTAAVAVAIISYNLLSVYTLYWVLSLFLEVMMMGLVALFFAMVLPSATVSALATVAFYVLARMMGQLLGILTIGGMGVWGEIMGAAVKTISVIIPRFDLMTQTSWLIYGPQGHEGFAFLLAQTGVFSFLVVSAAVIDLVRRQF
jgi:ABC-type transport system involved in multi-copper enzyme maturation permease subunit